MFDAPKSGSLPHPPSGLRQRVAVIGSGISGLSAAWMLHPYYEVTVFEKGGLGGHSHSVNVGTEAEPFYIDMGFIVFNEPCYPNLVALFKHLGVEHKHSDMSFSVSMDAGNLEYGSLGLKGLFAQKRNMFRPRYLGLLLDIMRFYRAVPKDSRGVANDYRLGDYLKDKAYGRAFIEDHLLPQAAAIWSTSAQSIMDYPLRAFVTFFENHGLLKVNNRTLWRTVSGASQAYVSALTARFKDRILVGTGATSVKRFADCVEITDVHGKVHNFDQVIFAGHADETLKLICDATPDEREILSNFAYTPNQVVLHTDASLMPKRRNAWASWNYIGQKATVNNGDALCVSYWMNLLQNLQTDQDYFVTLNPITPIDPAKTIKTMSFEHPLFNARAIEAQSELYRLQGQNRSWFCGAYFGAGFHEDGLQSGLAVAEAMSGLSRPWYFDQSKARIAFRSDMPAYDADIKMAAE
jgi:uncharacterized protein